MQISFNPSLYLIILLQFITLSIYGQDCCVEQDIDGITCEFCTAPEWDPLGTPDLSDDDLWGPSQTCPLIGLSSSIDSDGYAVFGNGEGITTIITGLIIGNIYAYGFEYANPIVSCFNNDGELTLELDGTTFTYPQESDWTTIIECFTASDTEITITFTSNPVSGSMFGLSVVDALSCDYVNDNNTCTSCCDIELAYNDTPEICPGTTLEIEPLVTGTTGTLQVEWTSIPSDGITYLNDISLLNPTFTYPYQDENPGLEYVFTLRVIDGSCEEEIDINVKVLSSEIPEFEDPELCITSLIEDLPMISIDGYTGFWSGDPISEYSDEIITLVFTIDPGQDNCLEETDYEFYVAPAVMVNFDIETTYCANDSVDYELPSESLEDLEGFWSPSEFTPKELGVGEHTFIFIGEDPIDCIQPLELTINVKEVTSLTFSLPDTLCTTELPYIFPTTSNQGITGLFTIDSLNNVFTKDTLIANLFTPDLTSCVDHFTAQVFIKAPELPLFSNLESVICTNDIPYEFPTTTSNGIPGTWEKDTLQGLFINDTTIINNFIYLLGPCTDTISYQFNIQIEDQPNFNLPDALCSSDLPYIFSTISENGISGNWTIPSIENLTDNDTTITNVFNFSNGNCLGQYTHQVNISSSIKLTFELPDFYCEDDLLYEPNPISLENVVGSWAPPSFDPSIISEDSIKLIWKPAINGSCADSVIHIAFKEEKTEYNFELENSFCLGDEYIFPSQSQDRNVEGKWTISNISELVDAGTYTNTFTPADDLCADEFILDFTVLDYLMPEFDLPNYLCFNDTDFVLPTVSINNISGNWNIPEIVPQNNLAQVIQLAFTSTENCINTYTWALFVTEPYDILINKTDPSRCGVEDGRIEIEVANPDLEFSIDEGINWTDNRPYDNLGNATYRILIRHKAYPSCISEEIVTLEGTDAINIDQSIIVDDIDCQADIGSIFVQQIGNDPLQFSIDGGLIWQDSPLFTDLAMGTYTIDIRRIGEPSCVQLIETVKGPESTIISGLAISEVTSCLENNGTIEINALGSNLAYSINGGIDFQASNSFTDLSEGSYDLVIQSEIYQNCDIDTIAILTAPSAPDLSLDFIIEPTACLVSNGSFSISSSEINVEFSIDGGTNWQEEELFTDLIGGSYTVIVRNTNFPDCTSELDINLATQDEVLVGYSTINLDPIGCDATNGSIEFINTSNIPLLYRIEGTNDFLSTPLFDNLSQGTYVIEIISQLNESCNSSIEIKLEEQDCECTPYLLNLSATNVSCDGTLLGAILIEPYTDEAIIWGNNSSNFNLTDLDAGQYTFTISYQNQECQYLDTINITQPDSLNFALEVFPTDCEEVENGIIEITNIEGGLNPYSFSIDGETYQDTTGFYNLSAANYNIFVQDLDGCITMKEAVVEISKQIDIELPSTISISTGETIILNPLIEATSIDSFKWTPIDYMLNPGELISEVQPEESISYTLSIYYNECVEVRTININVAQEKKDFYIPNVININDPENSTFYIQSNSNNLDIQASMYVYDRWGNLIFANENLIINDPNSGWDPSQSPGYIQGVYTYVLEYTANKNELSSIIGLLTVLR